MGKIGEVVKITEVEWETAEPAPISVPDNPSTPSEPAPATPEPELVPAGEPEP